MKILTTITEDREIEIDLPFLKKHITSTIQQYIAVMPDETLIDLSVSDNLTILKHARVEGKERDLLAAMKWVDMTEDEFLAIHATALKNLSLVPVLHDPDDIKDIL